MAKTVKSMLASVPDAIVDKEASHHVQVKKIPANKPKTEALNSWLSDEKRTALTANNIPVSLAADVAYKAKLAGMSVRGLLLKGLQMQGFEVPDEELIDGRVRQS